MDNFGFSMLCYWIAYTVVTAVGMLHTIFNIYVLKMSPMDEYSMGDGYEKTKKFHPLYNILIFPIFAYIYLNGTNIGDFNNVIMTSIIWGTITIIFDLFGWVIIKHPWSLTAKEFYLDYQPWITLIYIAIVASPFIAYFSIKFL